MNAARGLVVDASVAVKWHLRDEELVEEAGVLLEEHFARRLLLAAPAFIRYELANFLEQARRRKRISVAEAAEELHAFLRFGVHTEGDTDELVVHARDIAERIGSSVYDAMYVAFSEHADLAFVTSDRGLLDRVSAYPVNSYHLSDVATLL